MNTKYFFLAVLCYWVSLFSQLLTSTALVANKGSPEEDLNGSQDLEISNVGENNELVSAEIAREMLHGLNDNFAVVSDKNDKQKKSKKATDSKGSKKGKNKKKPQPIVSDDTDEEEEENDESTDEEEKEETIVIGKRTDDSNENSNTFEPQPIPNADPNQQDSEGEEDSDITHTEAFIGDQMQHFELQACTMVQIPLDQRGIEITVNPLANIQKVMLTSSKLNSCSEVFKFQCPPNAKFCQEEFIAESPYLKLGNEVCHHQVAFLYIKPESFIESLEFELRVTITDDVQCKSESAVNPAITDEQYCQSFDSEQCQDKGVDACASKCMWVRCNVKNQDHQYQSSAACVPTNTSKDSLQQVCSKADDFAAATAENQVIEYPVCAASTDESIDQSSSHINIGKILGITFGISLLLCVVFVCYYRHQFRINKRELCSPPNWCPNFLFPRMSSQMEGIISANGNREQEMVADYQPPVL